ncbi:hypothetical protein BN2497_5745 [Janthinobacterium sp. CG23_2]|nr:hypothetical protein BN2497_5745 [Janthinobacterium sp. CG23_2]CUU29270.1 hypothetical protein BN3177_5745 [Janthinobacterium sp. CG23_2]
MEYFGIVDELHKFSPSSTMPSHADRTETIFGNSISPGVNPDLALPASEYGKNSKM